jgi:hypothetical protein
MNEFLFVYRNTNEASQAAMGPEQRQQTMQKWMAWFKELRDGGHIKDPGQPLERVGKVVRGTSRAVTDGPYAETKDVIGGYTIVLARDLGHASELATGCPVLTGGGSVEVRPVMKMEL